MQTNPAVERNKTLNGPSVRGISPVGVYNIILDTRVLKKTNSALETLLTNAGLAGICPFARWHF